MKNDGVYNSTGEDKISRSILWAHFFITSEMSPAVGKRKVTSFEMKMNIGDKLKYDNP